MNRAMKFFGTVVALATPLWLLNLVLPHTDALPKGIPITDLGLAFVPLTAAVLLTWREGGATAVRGMFQRVFARGGTKRWWLIVVSLMPVLYLSTYAGYLIAGRSIVTDPLPALYMAPLILLLVFPLAIGEEAGYFGYLWDDWERRFGAFGGAVLFAVPWTALHIPSILQLGEGWDYIAQSLVFSAAIRVLWTWMYHNTGGSVLAVITVHAITNLLGSYIQQRYTSELIVVAVLVVMALWRTDLVTRRRRRHAEESAGAAV